MSKTIAKVQEPGYQIDSDQLFESLNSAIILVSHEGLIERVNLAAETLFNQSRRYLLGSRLNEIIDSDAVAQCVDQCIASNAQYTLREIELHMAGAESCFKDQPDNKDKDSAEDG